MKIKNQRNYNLRKLEFLNGIAIMTLLLYLLKNIEIENKRNKKISSNYNI